MESTDIPIFAQRNWRTSSSSAASEVLLLTADALSVGAAKVSRACALGASASSTGVDVFSWPHASAASRTARSRVVSSFVAPDAASAAAAAAAITRWARSDGGDGSARLAAPVSAVLLSDAAAWGAWGAWAFEEGAALPARRLLVFVNPSAGSGGGSRTWARSALLLSDAGVACEVIVTSGAGEAAAAVRTRDLSAFEGVVCVGGDGSLAEVVRGIMARRDWAAVASRVAIGILPAGSGNGLAVSLCTRAGVAYSEDNAAFILAKGGTTRIDLASTFCRVGADARDALSINVDSPSQSTEMSSEYFSCVSASASPVAGSPLFHADSGATKAESSAASGAAAMPAPLSATALKNVDDDGGVDGSGPEWGARGWSFLSLEWGLPADLDLESEFLRCLGALRFDVYAVIRAVALRRYRGRFSYVPAPVDAPTPATPALGGAAGAAHPRLRYLVPFSSPVPDSWKRAEGVFTFLWATNTSHQAVGVSTAAGTQLDDGVWTVTLMRDSNPCDMLRALLTLDEKGSFALLDYVETFRVVAWRLEPEIGGVVGGDGPHAGPGCIALDGERAPYGPVQGEVRRRALALADYFGPRFFYPTAPSPLSPDSQGTLEDIRLMV